VLREREIGAHFRQQARAGNFQDDVTVLRRACLVLRRQFKQIGNIEAFLESITIVSACNKLLRKRFLQPDTIGHIPTGGYTCNNKYSSKALTWLLRVEQTNEVKIMHGPNGRDYKVLDLFRFNVDGYCPQTRKIYEFFGCHWHGHTCQPFRDVITMYGETLAERYERMMSRLEQITRAGYLVKFQWEYQFDNAGIVKTKPELLAHPLVLQSPLRTRDVLYGGRPEAMRLQYKAEENETIQNHDVMSLYPYICEYFKFPVGLSIIHVGDACKDIKGCPRMEGLINRAIVPPEKFYYFVLPFRCINKLILGLCRTCLLTSSSEECGHTRDEIRALTGTWVMNDTRLGVGKG